jgi:hypothetical protein
VELGIAPTRTIGSYSDKDLIILISNDYGQTARPLLVNIDGFFIVDSIEERHK